MENRKYYQFIYKIYNYQRILLKNKYKNKNLKSSYIFIYKIHYFYLTHYFLIVTLNENIFK